MLTPATCNVLYPGGPASCTTDALLALWITLSSVLAFFQPR